MIHLKNKLKLILFLVVMSTITIYANDDFINNDDGMPPIPITYYRNLQWKNLDIYYSYINQKSTSIYSDATEKSTIVKKLKKYDTITVITRKNIKNLIWVFVCVEGNELKYGWIKDKYILFNNKFREVKKWKYKVIKFNYFDNSSKYEFDKNGNFIVEMKSYIYDSNTKEASKNPDKVVLLKGKVLQYNNIIWFKLFNNKYRYSDLLFQLGKNNQLLSVGHEIDEKQDKRITYKLFD